MKLNKYILASVLACVCLLAYAQEKFENPGFFSRQLFDIEATAGVNIGGASPIPLPVEIRSLESYSPNLNLQLGVNFTKWFNPNRKWGVQIGLNLATKGMTTKARVKNYGMEIIQDGKSLSGRWTGQVKTRYHSQQLMIPIQAVWSCSKKVKINLGPYLTYAFKNEFDGYVTDGYLREGDPTGDKIVFDSDSRATYDFDENLRDFHWGWQGGVDWNVISHFSLHANLMWGCNGIFEKDFKTITFTMYPIYLNLGFGYHF